MLYGLLKLGRVRMKIDRIINVIKKKIEKGLKPVCVICGERWRGLRWIFNIPAFIDVEIENKDFMKVVCGEKFDWYAKNKPSGLKQKMEGEIYGDIFIQRSEFKNPQGREYMRCTCVKCDTTFIRARDRLRSTYSRCPICDCGKQGISPKSFYILRHPEEKVTWDKWVKAGGK